MYCGGRVRSCIIDTRDKPSQGSGLKRRQTIVGVGFSGPVVCALALCPTLACAPRPSISVPNSLALGNPNLHPDPRPTIRVASPKAGAAPTYSLTLTVRARFVLAPNATLYDHVESLTIRLLWAPMVTRIGLGLGLGGGGGLGLGWGQGPRSDSKSVHGPRS